MKASIMANARILVVEDEIIIARELEVRLNKLDYDVVGIASSAREALSLTEQTKPDLVLMDIVLKGDMDGIEAAAEIQRRWRLPVIYVTAYTDENTLSRAKLTEPFGYILKPFSERELRVNIEMALYKHQVEIRMRKVETWFASTIAQTATAVIVTDHNGIIKLLNPSAETLTELTRHEAEGRQLEGVLRLVNTRTNSPIALQEGLAQGFVVCLGEETLLIGHKGTTKAVDVTVSRLRDQAGQPEGLVALFRDVGGQQRGSLACLNADLATILGRSEPLREKLQASVESLVGNLDAALARIWTLDDVKKTLELQASAGLFARLDGPHSRIPIGKSPIGQIGETGKPYLTNDVLTDPGIDDRDWASRESLVAFAGYPLLIENRLVGVMAIFARRPLTESEQQALDAVACNIAVSIELNRKDAALKRSEEQLQELTANIQQTLWMIDAADSSILYISPGYETMWGRSCQSLIDNPQSFLESVHPLDRELIIHAHARMCQTGSIDVECRVLRPDKSVRWVWIRGYPILEQGRIVRLAGVMEDITEKRRLAAERDALVARIQLHIERMPLAYILFDGCLRIADWNPSAERIFGYSKGEALGMSPNDLVPQPLRQGAEQLLGEVRQGTITAHASSENLTKSGRIITCEWFNTPLLDANGEFAGMLSLAQDVTEQKSLQEQLQQSQKMEAIGQMAGGVAHDFNNLLTVISGYSEILLDALESNDPRRESANAIREAGERAASLTRQLLAFSRKSVLEPKVLDPNDAVRNAEKLLHRLIGEDIQLAVVLDPAIGKVKIDPGQLGQVLVNLAVNSRDAMPRGGTLTIETRAVELSPADTQMRPGVSPGPYVRLTISDTGSGMTADVKARIFEPFFTTKEAGKGTGLGLAVVHGVIKQSGGHVEVRSEPDNGTTVQVYLPAVQDNGIAPEGSGAGYSEVGTETVLLVEDEQGLRRLARRVLQSKGYTVLEASGSQEAIQLVESHPGRIDLLLTDVVMPRMGGPELAEILRPRFPLMKVLFSSGYTDDAVLRHGLLQEKLAFLQKPYTPIALTRKVRQVLDGAC